MSSMIPQPPQRIQIGGATGGPAGPGGPSGQGDPDSASVVQHLKNALREINLAAQAENDDIDASSIHQLAAAISKQIANEQKLTDDVMGAGPGVKMMRKTANGGAAPGPGGGY